MAEKGLPSLRLEWRSPSELAENPANWRRHPPEQIAALTDTLAEVGWAGACLFNERTGRLIDGHARKKVALDQGAVSVPVLVGDWSEEDERKILATLDPLAAMAEADKAALDALLADVNTQSEAINAMLEELAESAEAELPEPGAGGDEFDATPDSWPTRTQTGDIWVIGGKHRLLVGDCTDAGNVALLMDGKLAGCVLTDPPYGQNQVGVTNDEPEKLKGIVAGAFNNLPIENGVSVFFQSPRTFPEVLDVARTNGWSFERMLWLYKTAQNAYPWRGWLLKSEAILVFSKGAAEWIDTHPYSHDTYQVSEVSGEIPDGLGWHGSVKPIAIVRDLLSRIGGDVYDPFLGSGTTLIAAHRLGRVCYGCEIEPRYADVILKRAEAEGLAVEKAN